MKKVCLILTLLMCFTCCDVMAAKLIWTAPEGQVDSYSIYMDTFVIVETIAACAWEIPQNIMDDGIEHSFQVTAKNVRGESDKSNEAILPGKPEAPVVSLEP